MGQVYKKYIYNQNLKLVLDNSLLAIDWVSWLLPLRTNLNEGFKLRYNSLQDIILIYS